MIAETIDPAIDFCCQRRTSCIGSFRFTDEFVQVSPQLRMFFPQLVDGVVLERLPLEHCAHVPALLLEAEMLDKVRLRLPQSRSNRYGVCGLRLASLHELSQVGQQLP